MRVAAPTLSRVRSRAEERRLMVEEVGAALRQPLPALPSKYFYDARGSRLFDAITRLPEYYPARTEERILERVAVEVAQRSRPRELVELGSGLGRKIELVLDAAAATRRLERCVLLDVSETALADSLARLADERPGLEERGIVGDFTRDLPALGEGGGRLVLFLGGTVGNLHPSEVPGFLAAVARQLDARDHLLLGVDLVKDAARLEAAYNDAAGVTAAFNRNILRVINAALQADFDVSAFEHVAFYDRENAWIEMRLRAARATRARVPPCGLELRFEPGDAIRTELSCKYTRASLEAQLAGTGLVPAGWYSDPEGLFGLALLRREPRPRRR